MEHIVDPLYKDKAGLIELFDKISKGNTILFLGAGASITDKKYLSKEIIEYYEARVGVSFEIPDIVDFVDTLSLNPLFDRKDFDNSVQEYLSNLTPTYVQTAILSIPWRQIITTNVDTLLEEAAYQMKNSSEKAFDLMLVREIKEYDRTEERTEVKYIKIHGCLSDKSKYPIAFSTKDFQNAKRYYKKVLDNLKNLSNNIDFIAIGYSFSDAFGGKLLKEFDSYNYRARRVMYTVDPGINTSRLPALSENRMVAVKMSALEFFQEYKKWEEARYVGLPRMKNLKISDNKGKVISLKNKSLYNLAGFIRQLDQNYQKAGYITEKAYYLGEEPDYQVIQKNYDVVKQKMVNDITNSVLSLFGKSTTFAPIIFLKGSFGTGKTTFTYRVINEITNQSSNDCVAFEITDPDGLQKKYIFDLLEGISVEKIIFYCDNIEIDSVFKTILDLQLSISSRQIPGKKVLFLLSIRENILERYKLERYKEIKPIPHSYEFDIDTSLVDEEVDVLLDKLNSHSIINFRDIHEKKNLKNKILTKYKGDTFLSLLNMVTDGKHWQDLLSAYEQLSSDCQKAFVYTALLHKHGLYMPAGLLRNLVSNDWDEFTKKVVAVEGKGILIQENVDSKGTNPDLYFRTKHPEIADKLIQYIINKERDKFKYYAKILSHIDAGTRTSRLAVDLIKVLRRSKELDQSSIDSLFERGYSRMENEPYFLFHYAIHLQYIGSRKALDKALQIILHAESMLQRRNDHFTHRRAKINFDLAKLSFKEDKREVSQNTYAYLRESKDLFLLKQQLDPCSVYSYYDFIDLMLWELENIVKSEEQEVKIKVIIEEQFDLALRAVSDEVEKINTLRVQYDAKFGFNTNSKEYVSKLDDLYENPQTRPYACILKYYYLSSINGASEMKGLLDELEEYASENDEVSKFLFKEYGRKLYNPNIRMKFFNLVNKMQWYEQENPLRFYYFNFVAESYNRNFSYARKMLRKIEKKYLTINPEFRIQWMDTDGITPRVFEGMVVREGDNVPLRFRSREIQYDFLFSPESNTDIKEGSIYNAHLYFFLNGIRADIL